MSDLDRAGRFGLLLLLGKGLKHQNRSYIFHKAVVSFPKVALQKVFCCLVFMTDKDQTTNCLLYRAFTLVT